MSSQLHSSPQLRVIDVDVALGRTSTDMIDRFYGSHVLSALDKGTEIVDSVHAKQERYAAKKAQ